ncbi:MAG: phosphoribosyltransferase family protein [Betaproteobacteria bacterium]
MQTLSRSSAETSWRALLAPRCIACALAPGRPLCAGCAGDFFGAGERRCRHCALRLPAATAAEVCADCLRAPPQFDATVALADYAPPVSGMVLALKYGHRLELARALGRLLAARLHRDELAAALLVPVPLAFERQAERGFNQAREIGRALAAALGIRLHPELLLRTRHTPAQESLKRDERRRNLRGAFAVRGEVAGRTVAVIDDVMTSGGTLEEIARVLKAAGAARVVNLIVARTQ